MKFLYDGPLLGYAFRPALIFVFLFVHSKNIWARPEYAVKTQSNCIACHANPWGGGPRTVYGKFYGSRNLGVGKYSNQDLFSVSVRGVAYYPKYPTQTSSGVALMEASGSANVPMIEESEDHGELRTVLTYNMAVLGSGAREVYLRYKLHDSGNPLPKYILVGRVNAPFGLLTDEHRTYTRMQTNMTLNNFEMGVGASGDFIPSVSYDFIVVNDFQSGGGFSAKDLQWGVIFNVRWSPSFLPFFIGASQNYQSTLVASKPYATSLYTAISLDRLTHSAVTATVLFEWVTAKNWNNTTLNPNIGSFFVPPTDVVYQQAVAGSQSNGYYGLLRYDLNARWMLFYKYDYLALDINYPADAFSRHGVGFEVFLNSNLILNTRVERAFALRPELKGGTAFAAQDDLIAMLRWWI